MTTKDIHEMQAKIEGRQVKKEGDPVGCSIGIMAYNEEANIARTIHAVLAQSGPSVQIEEIIIVASGCTDRTVPIVAAISQQEPRVRLCLQEKREGKASAINFFLTQATSRVAVLIGADVIPEDFALEALCAPFKDPLTGIVGGRPIPVNDPATFMGHAVHLLWRLHDRLARVHPKLGEIIAFKNIISGIPSDSAVDEISIQALICQLGYRAIYEPACIVYNKGPLTIRDFLKQRRRIYAGHLRVRDQQHYEASTMKIGPILSQLLSYRDFALRTPKQALWTLGVVCLEGLARIQGHYDYLLNRQQYIWQMVDSTKDLEAGRQKVRRICNAVSVIIFRFLLEGTENNFIASECEDREVTDAMRKLLPVLRADLRKEDKLTLSGSGIMTVVMRAEQHGAELASKRIQEIVQTTPVCIGMRGRKVKVMVAYSSLTFALKTRNGNMTVSSPLVQEAILATRSISGQEH